MLNWAFKQWISQPGRTLLVMLVFAGVLSLAMLFDGIRLGISADMARFPQSIDADLVAVSPGNTYFAMGPSSLPAPVLAAIKANPDVAEAEAIGLVPFILASNGKRNPSMLVAYQAMGGPPELKAGRPPASGPEIVLDANLARINGLELGDKIEVLGTELTIVGISTSTTSPFFPYAFVSYNQFVRAAIAMAFSGKLSPQDAGMSLVSDILVRIRPGADLETVRKALELAVPDADFRTPRELGAADAAFADRMLGPVLVLLSAMTWLITLLTMSVLRHAEVQSNLHQFGIQKALGVKPAGLATALISGGLLIALSAFPLALVMARGLAWVMWDWNPLYNAAVWEPAVLMRAVAVSLIAVVASVYLPWRTLVRLEPVTVFKR
jgi:ABC-type antimicrobial peptide transport system permease subunit